VTISDLHESFKIKEKIGIGTFSEVFLARNRKTRKLFAIKKISKKKYLQTIKNVKLLWNEIKIMKMLKENKHTITLYEVHETEKAVYLVLEYLRGGTL